MPCLVLDQEGPTRRTAEYLLMELCQFLPAAADLLRNGVLAELQSGRQRTSCDVPVFRAGKRGLPILVELGLELMSRARRSALDAAEPAHADHGPALLDREGDLERAAAVEDEVRCLGRILRTPLSQGRGPARVRSERGRHRAISCREKPDERSVRQLLSGDAVGVVPNDLCQSIRDQPAMSAMQIEDLPQDLALRPVGIGSGDPHDLLTKEAQEGAILDVGDPCRQAE